MQWVAALTDPDSIRTYLTASTCRPSSPSPPHPCGHRAHTPLRAAGRYRPEPDPYFIRAGWTAFEIPILTTLDDIEAVLPSAATSSLHPRSAKTSKPWTKVVDDLAPQKGH